MECRDPPVSAPSEQCGQHEHRGSVDRTHDRAEADASCTPNGGLIGTKALFEVIGGRDAARRTGRGDVLRAGAWHAGREALGVVAGDAARADRGGHDDAFDVIGMKAAGAEIRSYDDAFDLVGR